MLRVRMLLRSRRIPDFSNTTFEQDKEYLKNTIIAHADKASTPHDLDQMVLDMRTSYPNLGTRSQRILIAYCKGKNIPFDYT